MDLIDRLNSTAFLGREFLTWLWYRSNLQEGLFALDDGNPSIELFFTDRIALAAAGQGAEKVAVKAEDPSLAPEAIMALRQGKKVEKACIRIVRGQREWTVTVAGDTLAGSGIKIPALLTREEDEKLRERLALLDELDGMIVALFKLFLVVRLDKEQWATERDNIQAWIYGNGETAPRDEEAVGEG
jgi:hypothetical protein